MSESVEAAGVSAERRKEALAQHVAQRIAAGERIESQSEYQAVVVRGHRCNHLLHFVIGLVTLGLWWILVWLPLWAWGGEKRTLIQVDPYGNVNDTKIRG